MRLTPPKRITWWIALILELLAILGTFINIPIISGIAFWLAFAGGLLLLIATSTKGL